MSLSNICTLADLRKAEQQEREAAMSVPSPASSVTQDSSTLPPATAPAKGRTLRTSMMSGASGITISGGTFTNAGGTVYRKGAAGIAATSLPEAPLEESTIDTVIVDAYENVSDLTATGGKVDNYGPQQTEKGQSVHVRLFEGLKNSKFDGGEFTNAGSVTYVEPIASSSGEETPEEGNLTG